MYYEKGKVSMLILLPDDKSNLRQLEKSLLRDIDIKIDIVKELKENEVIVELPKFKIETRIDLPEPLSRVINFVLYIFHTYIFVNIHVFLQIGIKSIFTGNSGLTNISKDPSTQLVVQKVIQKAFIEVDELGTVAAAATGDFFNFKFIIIFHGFFFNYFFISAVIVEFSGINNNPIFSANRPFIFYIMHEPSGRILFSGKKEV